MSDLHFSAAVRNELSARGLIELRVQQRHCQVNSAYMQIRYTQEFSKLPLCGRQAQLSEHSADVR